MNKVVKFPLKPHSGNTIPTPTYHQSGDTYTRLEVVDNRYSPKGYDVGCVFIVYKGRMWNGFAHAILVNGKPHIGNLVCTDGLHFDFSAWDAEATTRRYGVREIEVLGPVIEIYPEGENGPRWVVDRPSNIGQFARASGIIAS